MKHCLEREREREGERERESKKERGKKRTKDFPGIGNRPAHLKSKKRERIYVGFIE